MKLRSLHARLVAGVAIWSIGIIVAASAIGITVIKLHPRQGRLVHTGLLALGGAVLVTAAVSVLRRGLSPLSLLQERLAAIRGGRVARLEGDYPTEVAPLVRDLNELLEDRDQRVTRAAARAGTPSASPIVVTPNWQSRSPRRSSACGATSTGTSFRHEQRRRQPARAPGPASANLFAR